MAKKLAVCLLCLGVLVACGPPQYKKQVIEDPLSPKDSTNYLIFDQTGQSQLIEDALSPDPYRNYLLFNDLGPDILLEDPLSPEDYRNYLLYERKKR